MESYIQLAHPFPLNDRRAWPKIDRLCIVFAQKIYVYTEHVGIPVQCNSMDLYTAPYILGRLDGEHRVRDLGRS